MERMRWLGRALFAASLAGAVTGAASAQTTVASNTTGTQTSTSTFYVGQSFTPTGSGAYNNVVFSFQSTAGTNVGAGNLYLFTSAYAGTPAGLSTANAYGVAAFNSGSFAFSPGVSLNAGTTYYAYADTAYSVANSAANPYAGGNAYLTSTGSNTATYTSRPVNDFRFTVLANAAPEPAAWALMILGFGLVGGTLRQRRRVDDRRAAMVPAA